MGDYQFAISGLLKKRAELAGLIVHLSDELRALTYDLEHIDQAIRIFDDEIDPKLIPHKLVPARNHAFRGQVTRIVMKLMREAEGPVSTLDVTRAMMEQRGFDFEDKKLRVTMRDRVSGCLSRWARRDVLERERQRAPGGFVMWRLKR